METLRDLAHRKDVWTQCVLCTHFARWRMVDLQISARHDIPITRLLRRLKCTNCGTYSAAFRFKQPDTDLKLLEKYRLAK